MPILKISINRSGDSLVKIAYPPVTDRSAICTNCEMPPTADNPIERVGKTPDGRHTIWSHRNCSSARDRRNEQQELESRDDGIFAFANKLRFVATNTPENSTVQETFPSVNTSDQKPTNMTQKQVDANYDSSGTPVPPKN